MTSNSIINQPIVKPIDKMPSPISFEIQPAKKTKDGLNLELHVIAELINGPGLVKRGYVKPNIPTFGAFELLCDEGEMIGGSDSAPAPLSYLAAGIAFCLLTHLKGYADNLKLDISSIKIEQKMKFQSRIPGMTSEMGGQMEGLSNGIETFVLIEAKENDDTIKKMINVAEQACMAAQTVINAVPASTEILLNGRKL
ncbi:hypothetical protein WH96_10035 [Kiloniella spongiae]|uniref:OsmC family protein n=1 Tax=Kiloniella spongiae TaxID=1489064 RepID=A0A0H2ME20_9PROT|nr:OsmC family protein [Kiloniella spongiae]KLN60804.1 hypothetical protein WH96_10035 [Kiloniella spongiae]